MPLLTFYDPNAVPQSATFGLVGETTTLANFPVGSHPLTNPIIGFRGMLPIYGWKCWTNVDQSGNSTVYNSYNHNLAAIPKSPGIVGFLFFHEPPYRTQWYGEDTYTMWDGMVLNGRSLPQSVYDNWRGNTIFNDMAWP
jgi:hypothetical protein